jgi:hypothetical protein
MDNKIRPKASKTINLYAVNCRFQYMSHIGKKTMCGKSGSAGDSGGFVEKKW